MKIRKERIGDREDKVRISNIYLTEDKEKRNEAESLKRLCLRKFQNKYTNSYIQHRSKFN